ncbi:hypothetical protein HBB16_16660 [Pseudonocardia sp. MCCB 268]|nr:hypothetical protein [Pseudonocardia cytotoxica]
MPRSGTTTRRRTLLLADPSDDPPQVWLAALVTVVVAAGRPWHRRLPGPPPRVFWPTGWSRTSPRRRPPLPAHLARCGGAGRPAPSPSRSSS